MGRTERHQGDKAPARFLIFIFLACVAVCAVFFSLGFVVGRNYHSPSSTGPVTENIAPASSDIPPTVNVPVSEPSSVPPTIGSAAVSNSGSSPFPTPKTPQPVTPVPASQAPKAVAQPGPIAPAPKPKPAPKSDPVPAAASNRPHYAVQVMASNSRTDAANVIKLLKSRGYPVMLIQPGGGHGRLYKIQVGPYPSRKRAEAGQHKLQKEGFKPFIVH